MGNASEELKAVADEVIGGVDDDGIYHYCLRRGLISAADCGRFSIGKLVIFRKNHAFH